MSEDNQNLSNNKSDKLNMNRLSNFIGGQNLGRLPDEIVKFVGNESYSLLIKGRPGTGKTTFALTLMDTLKDESNYFYISTRLSIKQLSSYFPWIKKFYLTDDNRYGYRFEDARLDEPESLFERITNQLMDVKSPVIIIDTWDTIASFMDRESRLNNERVLQIWRERAGAKLIFLSETIDLGIIDSIVDGVITLNLMDINSHIFRELVLNKLRGIPIQSYRHNYSLINGVFHTFDIANDINLFIKARDEFKKHKVSIHKKNLYQKLPLLPKKFQNYFNNFFGNKNTVTLIVDPLLKHELIFSIILRHICIWMRLNNKIIINNFDESICKDCDKLLKYYLDDKIVDNNLISQKLEFDLFLSDQQIDTGKMLFKKLYNIDLSNSFKCDNKFSKTNSSSNSALLKEGSKIMNVLSGNNISPFIFKNDFLTLLENSFTLNILILKDSPEIFKTEILEKTTCYRLLIKNKGILLQSLNDDFSLHGLIIGKEDSFIHWYPIL